MKVVALNFTNTCLLLLLVAVVFLFAGWYKEHARAQRQQAEQVQIKSLLLSTSETVLLQHATIGKLVATNKSLYRIVRGMVAPPVRVLASAK